MIKIDMNSKGVKEAPMEFVKHCKRATGQVMELAEQEAKKIAPSDKLKGSAGGSGGITHSVEMSGSKIIGALSATALNPDSNYNYAIAIHEGTGLYGPRKKVIKPIRAKVLVWLKGGADHPTSKEGWKIADKAGLVIRAKSTKGQKPNPFLKKGLKKAEKFGQKIFDKEIGKFNERYA